MNPIIYYIIIFTIILIFLSKNDLNIHYKWGFGVLTSFFIFFITSTFGSNEIILQYISFASAVTSIILAVLAIIFSQISESSLRHNVEKIDNASDALVKSAELLKEQTANIFNELKGHTECMSDIKNEIVDTKTLLKGEAMERNSNTSTTELENVASGIEPGVFFESLAENFLNNSSLSGLEILYATKLSKNKGSLLNLEILSKKVTALDVKYAHGFLVAASALGILNYTGDNPMLNITYINKFIDEKIESKLYERATRFEEDMKKKNSDIPFSITDDIVAIKGIFE